jgi:nucleotide-binding universal stress UspA family protein
MPRADRASERARAVLVGIANPNTVDALMDLAASLASYADYSVVATHVVTVPPQASLGSARGSRQIAAARRVLVSAIRAAADRGLSVRGVVEVAREVDEGIISAAATQRAELILVGHSDIEPGADRAEKSFDRIMHRVARGTRSDLIVAKFRRETIASVLVPVGRGTNLRVTGLLAQALAASRDAAVRFLHVVEAEGEREERQRTLAGLLAEHGLVEVGELEIALSDNPLAAIVERANQHDLTIVGADPRPSLAESIFGSWAERIATQAECTVLLVRAKGNR